MKENIENLADGTSIIKKLTPRKYDLISEKLDNTRRKHYGLVAQELELVLPELVSDGVTPGNVKTISTVNYVDDIDYVTDASGKIQKIIKKKQVVSTQNIPQPPTTTKAVNYMELIAILVQTAKEQQVIIEQLQADVEKLKKK